MFKYQLRLRLRVLSRFIIQTLERYHIAIGILRKYGSGKITAGELEERLAMLGARLLARQLQ